MSRIIQQGNEADDWGVCGFVSVLNALYQTGELKSFGRALDLDEIQQRLGAEIITYLKMTSVERPAIAKGILAYTQTFGHPYNSYTSINDICNRIASQLRKISKAADWTNFQGGIGVAMPPEAVEDYVDFVGKRSTVTKWSSGGPAFNVSELVKLRNCIVGCGRAPRSDAHNGLRHWVYVDRNGCLLNWGVTTDLKTSALPQLVLNKNYGYIPAVVRLQ